MFRTILVPLDGSALSEAAIPFAGEIAGRTGAELHLVHVHTTTGVEGVPSTVRDQRWDVGARDREREYLDDVAARVAAARKIRVNAELLDGPVIQTLEAYAATAGADLVVLTSHGRGGVERAWLGSVADQYVRRATRPVLLVRAREDDGRPPEPAFDRILVPLDGSPRSEAILGPAIELGEALGSRFTLLRVVEPPFLPAVPYPSDGDDPSLTAELHREAAAYLDRVADRFRARSLDAGAEVVIAGSPATAILEQADAAGDDLIAMSTHGRGGILRLLLGSVADKVVRGAVVPVLLFRGSS